jgi:hypothetical protein
MRRIWLGAFVAFFLIFGAWAFAAPYDGPPDEVQHVIRAAGVVSGQIAPEPAILDNWNGKGADGLGAYQQVPEGLHSPATCWGFDAEKSAACADPIHGGEVTDVPTSAGRYNPTYYLAVGLPVRVWPSWGGLVLSRLLGAAICAALLASAFSVLVRWSRFGLMLGGLLAVSTPMLAHLAGAVNPNGVEIAAGIALFAAGIPMLLDDRAVASRRPLYWLFGISAVLLALVRPLGPLWLTFAIAALVLGLSRQRIKELWSTSAVRTATIAIGAALLASAAWTLLMGTGDVVPPGTGEVEQVSPARAALTYFEQWELYLKGMVGISGWFDVAMPSPFYWIWMTCAAGLLLIALVTGGWLDRSRLAVIVVGGVVVPGILQVAKANVLGTNVIGGRYMMPLLVGLPLLGAFVAERTLIGAHHSRTMTRLFVIVCLPAHLVLLVYAMVRWQRGQGVEDAEPFNPFVGSWHPPTGSVLPILLMVAGLGLAAWMFWRGAPQGLPGIATGEARPGRHAAGNRAAENGGGTSTAGGVDGDPIPSRTPEMTHVARYEHRPD